MAEMESSQEENEEITPMEEAVSADEGGEEEAEEAVGPAMHLGEQLGEDLADDLGEDEADDSGEDLADDSGEDLADDSGEDLVDDSGEDLVDDSGVDEALHAWKKGGDAAANLDDSSEVPAPVVFPQLEPGVTQVKDKPGRLNNVQVEVTVELGRVTKKVRELSEMNVESVIETTKLAGAPFEIRVNGRLFAFGEVVVVSEMMAIRITNLVEPMGGDERS